MEKKNISKVIISVIAVAVVIAIVGGATFAYWQWQTADEQQTLVNVTVAEGITMLIEPSQTLVGENGTLRPTNSCVDYAFKANATVSIDNKTGVKAKPTFKLKFKSSKALSTAAWGKVNYAITELNGDCTSPLYQGTFSMGSTTANTWADTDEIPRDNVTFTAPPYNGGTKAELGAPTTHVYEVYVWLDSTYVGPVNTGTTVNDPLQDNTITVTWSGDSYVTQVFE